MVALLLSAALAIRLRRVRADQRLVLGDRRQDLVAHAATLQTQFDALNDYVQDVAARLDQRMATAEQRLDGAIAYRALVRYDAYGEMSGRQSTSIALLDATRSGIVLSSIHHRDQARHVRQAGPRRARASSSSHPRRTRRSAWRCRAAASRHPARPAAAPRDASCPSTRCGSATSGPRARSRRRRCWPPRQGLELELVPLPTIYDAVMAVHERRVERALVPIENSLEGAVNATLDALAIETDDVVDRRRAGAPDHASA